MKLLAIDTSGKTASAAVTDGSLVLAEKNVYTTLTHSQIILPMVQEVMNDSGVTFDGLDGIVCAKGPGSYTGLRIGIAAVKGMLMGHEKLLCAGISTLEALAVNCLAYRGRIIPVMAARKGIIYMGVYQSDGEKLTCIIPDKVCKEDELEAFRDAPAVITGDCCEAVKQSIFADSSPLPSTVDMTGRLTNSRRRCLNRCVGKTMKCFTRPMTSNSGDMVMSRKTRMILLNGMKILMLIS